MPAAVGSVYPPAAYVGNTPASAVYLGTNLVIGQPVYDDFGFAGGAEFNYLNTTDLAREMTAMKQAGATWFRLGIDWWLTQDQQASTLDWSVPDRLLAAGEAAGLKTLCVILETPPWARASDAQTLHGRPRSASEYGAFCAKVATRYKNRIGVYEIYNEPNLKRFWEPGSNASQYAAVLKEAALQIRAVDSNAKIMTAGLAPSGDGSGNNIPLTFLTALYAAGAKNDFDIFGIHPYPYPDLPSETQEYNAFFRMKGLYQKMVDNGDGGKKMWATEFGAPTGTAGNAVTEARQSQIIQDGIRVMRNGEFPFLEVLFVYSLRDGGTNLADAEANFGVLKRDWTRKTAYTALNSSFVP